MPVYVCAVSGGRRNPPAAAGGRGGPGGSGRGLPPGLGFPPGGRGRGLPGRVPPCLPPPTVGTGVRDSGDVYCQFTSFTGTKVKILAHWYKYKHKKH